MRCVRPEAHDDEHEAVLLPRCDGGLDARHGSMRWGFLLMRLGDQAVAGEGGRRADLGAPVYRAVESSALVGTVQGGPSTRSDWREGYRAASGNPEWEETFVGIVIPCESGWDHYAVSPGGHLGLGQFHPGTWESAGGGDWADPFTQGRNTAYWSSVAEPWQQWVCWP